MRKKRASIYKLLLAWGVLACGSVASSAGAEPSQNSPIESPVLVETARASEWREDWVERRSTEQAPFYNHFIGSLCSPALAGEFASVVEGVQRFKTKQAVEQYRGEFGEGLSAMRMESPLIWQGAKASAKTGVGALTQMYGLGLAGQSALEIPLRTDRAKVPVGSRVCATLPSLEDAEALLRTLGLWDATMLDTFTFPSEPGSVSVPTGTIETLVNGVTWTAVVLGDAKNSMISLSTEDTPFTIGALWDDISSRLAPLGLQFDMKASYVNDASEYRQRTWAIPDGRWISLTFQSGPLLNGEAVGNSSILLSIYPPLDAKPS